MDDNTPQIYVLACPKTGGIRYVGKARNPKKRLAGHLREVRRKTPLYDWIGKLRGEGLAPQMFTLRAEDKPWQQRETEAIAFYRSACPALLNVAHGGDEPYCPVDVRAENGRKNARAIHDDLLRRRVWELNRKVGELLRMGFVREEAKVKLRYAAQKRPDLFGKWANV